MKIITKKAGYHLLLFCLLIATACGNKHTDPAPVNSRTTLEAVKTETADINSPARAYQALIEGNQRYMNGQFMHVHIKRLNEDDDDGEKPFVAILTCPDFKIPAEILFDVDRNNILLFKSNASMENDSIVASVTDAVNRHNIQLVVVLGHHDCPSLKKLLADRFAESHVKDKKLEDAVVNEPTLNQPIYSKTAINNTRQVANRLINANPVISNAVKKTRLWIKPVFYNELHRKLVFSEGL